MNDLPMSVDSDMYRLDLQDCLSWHRDFEARSWALEYLALSDVIYSAPVAFEVSNLGKFVDT